MELSGLQTECRNADTIDIDRMSTMDMVRVLNAQDQAVPIAVAGCLKEIAFSIDQITPKIQAGGRLIYIGAGTSGRLGVLDASEIPPTYSADPSIFVGLIAGGDIALRNALEGVEDSKEAAVEQLKSLNLNGALDTVLGIATSGRTPYVIGGLEYAHSLGCLTIGLVCVSPSEIAESGVVDIMIAPITGPEPVTGSTRMKAGTATKLVLNMISSCIMIRCGKTFGNLMVDLKSSNNKLKHRSRRILRAICGETFYVYDQQTNKLTLSKVASEDDVDKLIEMCGGSVKLAILVAKTGWDVETAREKLAAVNGLLSKLLDRDDSKLLMAPVNKNGSIVADAEDLSNESQDAPLNGHANGDDTGLVVCVDGGGSKCAVTIANSKCILSRSEGGESNILSVGISGTVDAIMQGMKKAISGLPLELRSKITFPVNQCNQKAAAPFKAVWLGFAGLANIGKKDIFENILAKMFGLTAGKDLRLTTDIEMLASSMLIHPEIPTAIVMIAGTGSVATRFHKTADGIEQVARYGGWGPLLGDKGGGYATGVAGIQSTLKAVDQIRISSLFTNEKIASQLSEMHTDVCKYFNAEPTELIHAVNSPIFTSDDCEHTSVEARRRALIAGVSRIVFKHAFTKGDVEALNIVKNGAKELVEIVMPLVGPNQSLGLVMGGSLAYVPEYRQLILDELHTKGVEFAYVEPVHDLGSQVSKLLAAHISK